jgi:hypothetical protein|tara:strand:+ start:179 stop:436 length:258 start_codon:yes stop_codon:yes gene_type:complete
MAYIGPNFRIVNTENLTMGLLRANDKEDVVSYNEQEIVAGGFEGGVKKIIELNKDFKKRLPLCSAGNNKFWILNDNGEIVKEYLK